MFHLMSLPLRALLHHALLPQQEEEARRGEVQLVPFWAPSTFVHPILADQDDHLPREFVDPILGVPVVTVRYGVQGYTVLGGRGSTECGSNVCGLPLTHVSGFSGS